MANFLPSITQYLTKNIDELMTQNLCSSILEQGSKYLQLDFKEVGYIRILSLLTDGLSDYYTANTTHTSSDAYSYRAGSNGFAGFHRGNVGGKWEIKELRYKRGVQLPIDHVDDMNMANMAIANTVSQAMRTRIIPEVDEQRFSTLAENTFASLGNLRTESSAIVAGTAKITNMFDTADEWLYEHGANSEDYIYFVSPQLMTALKQDPTLQRYLIAGTYNSGSDVTFAVLKYNGHPIIEVPSSRFYTNPVFGENGYYPSATSCPINFIACDIKAIIPVKKIEFSKIYDESVITDFYGWLWDFLIYYDTIVPMNKIPAIYADVTANTVATAKGSVLQVADVAGNATGNTLIKAMFTLPQGINGTLFHSKTAIALGSAVVASADVVEVPVDSNGMFEEFAPLNTNKADFFALVDGSGKAVAVSDGAVTLLVR